MPRSIATKCKIDECTSLGELKPGGYRLYKKGYCTKHYTRLKRYGSVDTVKKAYRNGRHSHPLERVYDNMLSRCNTSTNESYENYGGRGIRVCDRWSQVATGFPSFVEDMGERPKGMTLDRIDNDGNYEPSNCRWATKYQQASNTRVSLEHTGVMWNKERKRWTPRIFVAGKQVWLGTYTDKELAIKARRDYMTQNGLF